MIPVHLQLLVPITLDNWLRLAELSVCFLTIRAETQMLVVDVGTKTEGRGVPRTVLDWETNEVLSKQTSTNEGTGG